MVERDSVTTKLRHDVNVLTPSDFRNNPFNLVVTLNFRVYIFAFETWAVAPKITI